MVPSLQTRPERPLPPFPFRVGVVDDTAETPARIARLLGPTVTVLQIGSAEALDEALSSRVDLLVVEHRLAWSDSLAVIRRARALVASLAVLVLTDHGNERLAVATLRAGAVDYLRASTPDAEVREALCDALSPWNGRTADDPNGVPALLETMGIGFVRSAPDGRLLDANPAAARMARLPGVAALASMHAGQFYASADDRDRAVQAMDRDGVIRQAIGRMVRADRTLALAETDARAVRHADGRSLCYEAYFRDATERERVREHVAVQASLLEHVRHAVVALDADLRISFWNRHAASMLGWTADEVLGRHLFDVLVPPDMREVAQDVLDRLHVAGEFDFIADDLTRDGQRIPTHKWVATLTGPAGARTGIVIVAVDVRELHQREQDLQRALADREDLLREIHHRVKNHLQIVSSLLNLQLRGQDVPALRPAVLECQARLRAIGTIHELLYRAPGVASVDVGPFVAQLVARLASMGDELSGLTLGRVVPVEVSVDFATNLGLMLTEVCLSWTAPRPPAAATPGLRIDLDAAGTDRILTITESDAGPRGERSSRTALADGLVAELAREMRCTVTATDGPRRVRVRFGTETT